MRKTIHRALSCFLISASFLVPLNSIGCTFSTNTVFNYTVHPDFPLQDFAAGDLGVVHGTFARSYLLVAYRYLSGKPLSKEEQDAMLALWENRLAASDWQTCNADTTAWISARKAVPGVNPISKIETERSVSKEENWQTYCNCQSPAFETAAKTLKDLVTKYGADSDNVKQWLAAQDQVFSNCGNEQYGQPPKEAHIPAAAANNSEKVAQQNRVYQIAAAKFYAQMLPEATKDFEAIAADETSPWRAISGYLAVRGMIRQATLSKNGDDKMLVKADELAQKLAKDPAFASIKNDLKPLVGFVEARIAPAKHLRELVDQPLTEDNAREITKTLDIYLGDADNPVKGAPPAEFSKIPAIEWIMTIQGFGDDPFDHAFSKWHQNHALPWLIAALDRADAKTAQANELIAAAEALPKDSPGYWTAFVDAHHLMMQLGKQNEARTALLTALSDTRNKLTVSTRNLMRQDVLQTAPTLDDFAQFAATKPACECTTGMVDEVPNDLKMAEDKTPVFMDMAARAMDTQMPVAVLSKLANNPAIPTALRQHLAWSAWVRAVLVGDVEQAKGLATLQRTFNKDKTPYFDRYLSATTTDARDFAATNLMIHFSSANPVVGYGPVGSDSYGDDSGWWWGKSPVSQNADIPSNVEGDAKIAVVNASLPFLTAAERASAKAQIAKLASVTTAPNYFAKILLTYAKANPEDPRVPESLHWGVKATHYGFQDEGTKALSKQMFDLLHTKYKKSPWTQKTPYYYG